VEISCSIGYKITLTDKKSLEASSLLKGTSLMVCSSPVGAMSNFKELLILAQGPVTILK
jgi:hypothetical protein